MKFRERPGFGGDFSCEIDGERLVRAFRKAALDGLRAFMEGLEAGLGDEPTPAPRAAKRKTKAKAAKAKPKAKAAKRGPAPRA